MKSKMKSKRYIIIVFFVSFIIFNVSLIVRSFIYRKVKCGPPFKAGDCIAKEWGDEPEAWEKRPKYRLSEKIVEVGKHSYRTKYHDGSGYPELNGSFVSDNHEFNSHTGWVQVDCKTLEKIK
mgnify:CR=1 FL=1